MWLWQRSEHSDILFVQLLGISIIAHLAVGFMLFVLYQGNATTFHVTMGAHGSRRPALFIGPRRRPCGSTGIAGTAHLPGRNSNSQRANAHPQSSTPIAQNSSKQRKAILASDTSLIEDKTQQNKAKSLTRAHPKKSKVIVDKKKSKARSTALKKAEQTKKQELPKPQVQPKKTTADKQVTNKQVPKPEKAPEKIVPVQPMQQPITPNKQPEQTEPDKLTNQSQQPVTGRQEPGAPEEIATPPYGTDPSLDNQEFNESEQWQDSQYMNAEEARMHYEIERELGTHWKPPKGLSKDLECHVKVLFGGDGTIVDCSLEKKSGVLIYDMAARAAAKAMKLPRWAWGKEFTVAFKQ